MLLRIANTAFICVLHRSIEAKKTVPRLLACIAAMPPRRSDQCPDEQRRLSPARESLGSRRRSKELVGFGSCTDHGRRRLTSKVSPSNAKQKYESLKMSPRCKPDDFDNRLRDFSAFVEVS